MSDAAAGQRSRVPVPVVTIDGPSGTGKGTIAAALAKRLGFQVLDSGALYRTLALAALRAGVDPDDGPGLGELAGRLRIDFVDGRVLLNAVEVEQHIRTEDVGRAASRVAVHPEVRLALLDWQRAAAVPPGLVADGRDMGSRVFPDAQVKIYLDASPEERVRRRYKQLKNKGVDANLQSLAVELQDRDARDRGRAQDPLIVPDGAFQVDTTELSIDDVLDQVLAIVDDVAPALLSPPAAGPIGSDT
jgi:CMP/dCMP kinase